MAKRRPRKSTSRPPERAPKAENLAPRWSRLRAAWLPLVVVLAATTAVYARVAWFDFQDLDDLVNVRDHPGLRPLSWAGLRDIWTTSYYHLYAPVTYSWWALVSAVPTTAVGGQATVSPVWFHLGNLGWHLFATALVYRLLVRLIGDRFAAACGAALFGLHPLHVESVAWITEAKGLLAAGLGLLAMVCWWKAVPGKPWPPFGNQASAEPPADDIAAASPRARAFYYLAATLFFVAALLAKPSAVVVPVLIGLIDLGWRRPELPRRAALLAPWLCASAVLAWYTKTRLQADEVLDPSVAAVGVSQRWQVASDAVAFYLGKLAWPVGLAADYARSPKTVVGTTWAKVAWLVPVALGLALARLARGRYLLTALGVFLVGLSPALGLVAFGYQQFSTVADRYAYLALLGPCLALAVLLAGRQRAAVRGLAVGLLLLYALLSFRQVSFWRDTTTLFDRNLALVPQSYLAHEKLAAVRLRQGQPAQAAAHYRAAIEFHPDRGELHNKLGHALAQLGRAAEAEVAFRRATEVDPDLPEAHYNLGTSLAARGDTAGSLAQFQRAIALRPTYSAAHNNLGVLYSSIQRYAEAIAEYRAALAGQPNDAQVHYNLAGALDQVGMVPDAIEHYRRALALRPDWGDAAIRLSWLWSTAADPLLRNGPEATRLMTAVCQATKFEQPVALDTLAAAQAASGDFSAALQTAARAQETALAQGKAELAERIRVRAETYRQRQPYVAPR